ILAVIAEKVPMTRLCPTSRCWWTQQLADLKELYSKLSHQLYMHQAVPKHPSHAQHKDIAAQFKREVDLAKERHWHKFLKDIDEHTIWTANKY
ncbi:hypothetical protein ARMGADRAFT_872853, partial [Armillaria gallica]